MKCIEGYVMNGLRRTKEKFKNCFLNGFFLDQNTFLKADDAEVIMVSRRDDEGKVVDKPMIVLKNVVEMMVDHKGKVVAVENKPELGVWLSALENALDLFNNQQQTG
jgi:hypothetical protein